MTRLIWCGDLLVEGAAIFSSLPTLSESICYVTAGLLGAMPIGYGIAASMLSTLTQET